jgi:aminopeptidase S
VNCLITGLSGVNASANDVDGGMTTIESPPIALPSAATLTLRFSYYVGFLANATSQDFFRVRIIGNNGAIAGLFARMGNGTKVPAVWTSRSVNLSAWAGQTVRIRFEAADFGAISMVEAGVDNVEITKQ